MKRLLMSIHRDLKPSLKQFKHNARYPSWNLYRDQKNGFCNDYRLLWNGLRAVNWIGEYDTYGTLPPEFVCEDGQPIDLYCHDNQHNCIFWPSDRMRELVGGLTWSPVEGANDGTYQ